HFALGSQPMVPRRAGSASTSDSRKPTTLASSLALDRQTALAHLRHYLDHLAVAGAIGCLPQSPHISYRIHHRSDCDLPDFHRANSRIPATPVLLGYEAYPAVFSLGLRSV